MLKLEAQMLLVVLLIYSNGTISPFLSYILAFVTGICLISIPDLIKGKITPLDFSTRLIQIFALVVGGALFFEEQNIKKGFIYYIWAVTLFSDIIISIIIKKGRQYIENKSKQFDNE